MTSRAWRALAPAALALLALPLTSTCARKPAPKPQEVAFWVFSPVSAIQPLVRQFEAENPTIHVDLRALDEPGGRDTLALAVFAKNAPPDLCELPSRYVSHFMLHGALSDWSAGVADLRARSNGWDMCMVGDAIYGLPWRLDTRALYYNKTLFQRVGLDSTRAPETWTDLRTAAARIQKLRGGVHGYGLPADSEGMFEQFVPFAWSNGGEILSAGADSSRFDSPENREALEFLLGLRASSLLGSEAALDSEFVAGRLGMRMAGCALSARLSRAAPGPRFGVGLVPRPDTDAGTHASLVEGDVLVSFTSSRRKEDALRLARFLAAPAQQLALYRALPDRMPASLAADSAAGLRDRPAERVLFRQLETARAAPNSRNWYSQELILASCVNEALRGTRTVAWWVATADTGIANNLRVR